MATATREVLIQSPYSPRVQFLPFHDRTQRWAAMVCHRRAGKTVACINDLIKGCAATEREDARFAYIAPFFNQAKDVAWLYVRKYTECIPGMQYNEGELRADFPGGARLRLYGGDNPDRLRGIYLDGVVLDEPADMDPRLWPEVIRPALSDRHGWAVFIGTPRGRNDFYELCYGNTAKKTLGASRDPDWFFTLMRASETHILDEAELTDARKQLTEAQYEQEYECSFEAAIMGAYYAREMAAAAKRITSVPHYPGIKVDTWWDLGARKEGRTMAVGFVQHVGHEIHCIDYLESSGTDQGLPHFAAQLQMKQSQHGYVYGTHVWPHDGGHMQKATGETLDTTMLKLGFQVEVLPVESDIGPGIDHVRNTLARMWWDAEKCERWVEALRNYRADYDEEKKTFKPHPRADWAAHPADMTRYGCMHQPSDWGSKKLVFQRKGIV